MTTKTKTPSAIKRQLKSYQKVVNDILNGLDDDPLVWGDGQRSAFTKKAKQMGVTLVTKTHAQRLGYRLKRTAKPIGYAYFKAPIKRSADIYILECHFTQEDGS